MKRLLLLPLLAASLSAASFTPYVPTPHATEVDLDDILAPYTAAGFVRVPDDLDLLFPITGYDSTFILAFEDLPLSISDNDFNDVVLEFDSSTLTFLFIAGYSADSHAWYESAGAIYLDSAQLCCGTGDFSSLSDPDRMLTWGKPVTQPPSIPEPASVVLMGGGLLAVVWFRRRAR